MTKNTSMRQALCAAFLPDCRDAVDRWVLIEVSAEAMSAHLADAVASAWEADALNSRKQHFGNLVYRAIIGTCEAREVVGDYRGNGHHWAQRLVVLAEGDAVVREVRGEAS